MAMVSFAISLAGTRTSKLAARDRVPALVGSVGETEPATAPDSELVSEVPKGRRAANVGMSLTWLAFAMLLVAVVMRGIWAGRVPWGNMYEFSITSALGVLGAFLIFSLFREIRWLGIYVTTVVLLTLGLAVKVLYTEAAQLVPALKSYWLLIHVSAAVICGGAFTIAAGITIAYLIQDRRLRRTPEGAEPPASRLPSAERLELLNYKILTFAFPLWTFAVVSGAIWAESAWGRYWGWDPKETWAFITWVIYAAYLHARTTAGWRGRRAAWISLVGFLAFLINYFGVNLFVQGLHSYKGF
ncbi:MAG: c-type cytochrome biogenesis protein CcsB [Actinobacteria bacterium]|nr:c-type cytochrome biogenesis protein CcsB [Actinomycetota bacterium]